MDYSEAEELVIRFRAAQDEERFAWNHLVVLLTDGPPENPPKGDFRWALVENDWRVAVYELKRLAQTGGREVLDNHPRYAANPEASVPGEEGIAASEVDRFRRLYDERQSVLTSSAAAMREFEKRA